MKPKNLKILALVPPLTLACLKLASSQTAQPVNPDAAQLKYLSAGINDAYEHIDHIKGVINRQTLTPGDVVDYINSRENSSDLAKSGNADERFQDRAEWAVDSKKLMMQVWPDKDQGNPNTFLLRERLTSDGTVCTDQQVYQRKDKKTGTVPSIYSIGVIDQESKLIKNGLWTNYNYLDPRFYVYTSNGILLSDLFSENGKVRVEGEDTIYGSKCVKVRHTSAPDWHETFWIDTDHGFMARRVEFKATAGAKEVLVKLIDVPEVTQAGSIWMPSKVSYTDYIGEKRSELVDTLTYSDYETLYQDLGESFRMNWLLGTVVENRIEQKTVIVASVLREDMEELVRIKAEREKKETTNSKAASKPSSPQPLKATGLKAPLK